MEEAMRRSLIPIALIALSWLIATSISAAESQKPSASQASALAADIEESLKKHGLGSYRVDTVILDEGASGAQEMMKRCVRVCTPAGCFEVCA
jgi:hypothetical protein